MKHTYNYLFLLLLLLPLLHACNGDVFVDEVKVPLTEATLSGDGDTLTLRFNTSKWQLNNVYDGMIYAEANRTFAGRYYTPDGTDMGVTSCFLDGKGIIKVDCPPYELTLIRRNDKELQVCLGDNPTMLDFTFTLAVGDRDYFQQHGILIKQSPSSGYVIDRIEYTLVPGSIKSEMKEDLYLSIFNATGEPQVHTCELNKNMPRHFVLSSDVELHLVAMEGSEAQTIQVPSADISQGLKLSDERIAYYSYGDITESRDIEQPFVRTVTLRPGRTRIMRIAEYQTYSADYTLYLHNAKTGKPYSVQGRLRSTTATDIIGFYLDYKGNEL